MSHYPHVHRLANNKIKWIRLPTARDSNHPSVTKGLHNYLELVSLVNLLHKLSRAIYKGDFNLINYSSGLSPSRLLVKFCKKKKLYYLTSYPFISQILYTD